MNQAQIDHHFRFLGFECRDKITGFAGVGASVAFDVYGCIQTCLTPKAVKAAKEQPQSIWFDNNRLETVSKRRVMEPQFMAPIIRAPQDRPGGFAKPSR
jgi:hypothetical protein